MYDLETVKAWAQNEIAKEGEDFIYKKSERSVYENGALGSADCYYYEDGVPSCLVGRMLDVAGLITAEKIENTSANEDGVIKLIRARGFSFTEDAKYFMSALQQNQDGGATWGRAYRLASDSI